MLPQRNEGFALFEKLNLADISPVFDGVAGGMTHAPIPCPETHRDRPPSCERLAVAVQKAVEERKGEGNSAAAQEAAQHGAPRGGTFEKYAHGAPFASDGANCAATPAASEVTAKKAFEVATRCSNAR